MLHYSSALVWTVAAAIMLCCPALSFVAEGRESAYQFVKRRAACLDLGGDIDESIPPYQNWFDHVIFGNPVINVSVSAYLHGIGSVIGGGADGGAIQEGLRTLGNGLLLRHHVQGGGDTALPRSSSTPQYTPHFQQVMRRMNTTLPVYAGLCDEDDEVHHLRTMQCVGMLGFTSQSSSLSLGGEESSSSSSSSEALTPEERKANRRKRAVAKAIYGGGPESKMSADEGALRQQLWCRALLTCDGGRNGFMDLCGHVIAPMARMRRDALSLDDKEDVVEKPHAVGIDDGDNAEAGLSATVLVRRHLLRTQERRRLRERKEEREFDEEDAAEEARNRIVQASRRYSRERPGEGDDLLTITSKTVLSDDSSNSAESFLVY